LRRISLWRVGAPLALLCAGLLFATSATNARGTDLRPSRNTTLAGLVEEQSRRSATLVRQHAALTHDIETLQAQQGSIDPKLAKQLDDLSEQVGTRPVTGPGLTVTLQDAPPEVVKENPDVDENWLVIHQQDIQAVVNAMWKAGARAVTIQGQRVVSTTGIRCIGNSVQLQGVPYSQPYRISAVGDVASLSLAIANDPYLQVYRADSADPDINVGWDETVENRIEAPAYNGLTDLQYAKALPPSPGS
jgi:uncharacterized protein YlxW (UPF0749 family)